jgi:hypothetical protein
MPDLLTALLFAEAWSSNTPVELGLVITLALAVGGWMVDRHRIGVLERGFTKHEDTTHKHVSDEFAELRREQRATEADCLTRFADLQRQVDRAAASSARSGTWSQENKP